MMLLHAGACERERERERERGERERERESARREGEGANREREEREREREREWVCTYMSICMHSYPDYSNTEQSSHLHVSLYHKHSHHQE